MVLDKATFPIVAVFAIFYKIIFNPDILQQKGIFDCLTNNMNTKVNKNRGKSETAFRELVQDHGDRIYNLALMKCGQVTLAEDITQETFIRVFKGINNFRGQAQLSTWIYRIALNVCHTVLKKESKNMSTMTDIRIVSELVAENSDVEALFVEQSQKQQIRQAIATLPPQQSDSITLFYLREFKYSEVAEIMNIPINTVKSHIRRAKENLRNILQEDKS